MTDYTIEEIQAVEFAHKFLTETLDDWTMQQGCSSPMEVDDGLCAMWHYVEQMENFLDPDAQQSLSNDVLDFAVCVIRDEIQDLPPLNPTALKATNTLEKMMVRQNAE